MDNKHISPELLKKYLEGKCSQEEIFLVDEWYMSLAERDEATVSEEQFDQLHHLKKVETKIESLQNNETVVRPLARSSSRQIFFRLAVAAMLLVVAGFGIYLALNKDGVIFSTGMQPVSVFNKTRQVKTHTLPDGSIVSLNPGSKIRYNKKGFEGNLREVSLEGEAFFEVTKDAARPFLVNSEAVLVKVLGTSFNVKANQGASEYEVSVVTGKVSVSVPEDEGKQITLLPNQQGVFKVKSRQLITAEIQAGQDKLPVWQPVSLTFENEKLGEVMRRLEKKFDVEINLANPDLENCLVKASFDNNRLSEILEMTMQIVEAKYQMQGDVITIEGKGCANSY
ncbi:FecR family protein [Dyadobacter diqingensis]|uniref:FecR family protein n=1 Tax=Dyadobacter diqingensis TaxID=2938121 RepID=UPI0020C1B88F|nr:FecR domain-containing protein [Dyadobacter diqingensis]